MDPKLKKILRGISLDIRRSLEGRYDDYGVWQAGDLERRLNELGVRRDRDAKPMEELPHLPAEDKAARRLVDGYLKLRDEAGVGREAAVSEFVREAAYSWANRLFALRCMEARTIIDEVILQKPSYGGRSMVHNRFAKKNPDACAGADDGLFTVLFTEFARLAQELPVVFDPKSPAVALRPSVAALKNCIALLSGTESVRGQEAATDDVFVAPDAFGWAYQYWNADEKDRVFKGMRTKQGTKIEGADIIPATQLYTEPYMVKFLVQNSLGALWMGMYPDSKLCEQWEYYVKDADRAPVKHKRVQEISFLDPAQGSGHFHLEAFDLFYAMYAEEAVREGRALTPREICAAILNNNLFGIDIDGRSVQIATAALWMKAKERAPELEAGDLTSFHQHLVATNIRLPRERNHLKHFLQKHPEDEQLRPALEQVFQGLEHADELGSLLQIEELVDVVLRRLKAEADKSTGTAVEQDLFQSAQIQSTLPVGVDDYDKWKRGALKRLQAHFEAEAQSADPVQAFFGESARKGLTFFDLLARRYDVVAANPPYMGAGNMGHNLKSYVSRYYESGKRDLYAAFILRCEGLASRGGYVAMVTMQGWMFQRYFRDFRYVDAGGDVSGRLHSMSFRVIAHLGSRAFDPEMQLHDGVAVALFSAICAVPTENHELYAIRCLSADGPDAKASVLKGVASGKFQSIVFHQCQTRLTQVNEAPVIYWLSPELLKTLAESPKLGTFFSCLEGTQTGRDQKYIRHFWEVDLQSQDWAWYLKGGGYRRWCGLEHYVIKWRCNGSELKFDSSATLRNYTYYFRPGYVYTDFSNGCLGLRVNRGDGLYDLASPSIFSKGSFSHIGVIGLLNSRLMTYLVRALSPNPQHIRTGYLKLLPYSEQVVESVERLSTLCLRWSEQIVAVDLTERSFCPIIAARTDPEIGSQIAALHSLEALIEQLVFAAFGVAGESLDEICKETGTPVGFHALISGYDAYPSCLNDEQASNGLVAGYLVQSARRHSDVEHLKALKGQLKQFYVSGQTRSLGTDENIDTDEISNDDDDTPFENLTPIPTRSFLEDLSNKLQIHPISVYWLLKEGIERDGWRCLQEERRIVEDRFIVVVLWLLGYRWPKQLDAGEPLPVWADQDGVIPITIGGGERTLLERVRERLTEDFAGSLFVVLEREFDELVGVPLEQWLAGPFFVRHISQFKKRPIAWQIETDARGQRSEGKKKKRGEATKPVFACLIYYHRLSEDLLPKLRTHYVGPLRVGFETELRTLERLANPTAEQEGRKLQLDQWIEEMKAFDVKLEQVVLTGFGPAASLPMLRQYAINDALLSLTACWLGKLNEVIVVGPLTEWQRAAAETALHLDMPVWVSEAFTHLDYFCAVVGPKPQGQETYVNDPTSADLAPLVCADPADTVSKVLALACGRWWQKLDDTLLAPLKAQLKQALDEQKRVKEELELDEVQRDFERLTELADSKDELKLQIKELREEINAKTDTGKRLRSEIESWECPEAASWDDWLGKQPVFDHIASLDGERNPPLTIGDFVAQESVYAPDINDGVRVNIAPLQKAGLLHADVLDAKDIEKAISDRAEWRSDERRWVREGKLPQPGWWDVRKGTI